jgi:hypothetical protein
MANLQQLNEQLQNKSYVGSATCATLEDYKLCTEISAASIDAEAFPHLARWHSHVSFLKENYPQFDYRGSPVPQGQGVVAAAGVAPTSSKQTAAPKNEAAPKNAAPKKEAAAKKDASAKKEAKPKKEPKQKAAEKTEEPPKDQTPEDPEKLRKEKLKKVIKEGGKRGVEIEGAADMGGLQFFCCSVDEPEGDLELLKESIKAMNAKPIPGDEERKGCSGHIGKMIFSVGIDQLGIAAFVPPEKQSELSCEEWLTAVLNSQGGEVSEAAKEVSTGFVKTNSDKNVFPLKIREPMIIEANNFLRKRGLFPEDNDSDDDVVFGDDDFPSM